MFLNYYFSQNAMKEHCNAAYSHGAYFKSLISNVLIMDLVAL